MIACNRHPPAVPYTRCELQARALTALVDAQKEGDSVVVLLVDREDPAHMALACIGTLPPAVLARVLELSEVAL